MRSLHRLKHTQAHKIAHKKHCIDANIIPRTNLATFHFMASERNKTTTKSALAKPLRFHRQFANGVNHFLLVSIIFMLSLCRWNATLGTFSIHVYHTDYGYTFLSLLFAIEPFRWYNSAVRFDSPLFSPWFTLFVIEMVTSMKRQERHQTEKERKAVWADLKEHKQISSRTTW